MIELVFYKSDSCYYTSIDLGSDTAIMELDTGSPISIISIPNLLQITGESLFLFRRKASTFISIHEPLSLGVYGSQVNSVSHEFIPYLIKNLKIGEIDFPFFLFWVDITNLNRISHFPSLLNVSISYVKLLSSDLPV